MRKSNYVLALAAATTVSGITGVSRAATDTWTGAVQAVDAGTNAYPVPSALWNTSDANWTTTNGGTKYIVGDTVKFTDNFAGITNIVVPSSGLNPGIVEFTHVGAGVTNYNFLTTTSTAPIYSSSSPFSNAYSTQQLILDANFNGSVTLNATSAVGLFHSTTTINGGTLNLTANGLPTYDIGAYEPNVTLNGGTLALGYVIGTTGNNGVLNVTSNSTLSSTYVNPTAGASSNNRTWGGQIRIASGAALTINSLNNTTVAQLGAQIAGSGGTIRVGNSSILRLDTNYAGSANTIYDTNTSGVLRNNLGANASLYLGALTGQAGSFLSGSDNGTTATTTVYNIGSFASSTFAGSIIDDNFLSGSTPIANPTAINKVGASTTLTLTGASTNTGATTVSCGTLALDFSAAGAPATNIINNGLAANAGSALSLVGGTLLVNGKAGAASSQTFNGLTLGGGTATIQAVAGAGGTTAINLGAITRSPGGVVNFVLPSGTTSAANGINTTTANAIVAPGFSTILGGYATVNGNTWAVSGTGGIAGTITGLTNYSSTATTPLGSSSGLDVDVAAAGTNSFSAALSVNSLRFNDAAATTLDASNGLTVGTGGVLVTPTAGAVTINNSTISTGSTDLVLINNSANTLTINSDLSIPSKILTTSGPGTVVLSSGGNSQVRNVIGSGVLQVASDAALGTSPAALLSNNVQFVDGGTLQFAANTTVATNRGMSVGINGGAIDTQANSVTYGGAISGNANVTSGAFSKLGTGTLTLTGSIVLPINASLGAPLNIQNGRVVFGSASTLGSNNIPVPVVLGNGSTSGILQVGDANSAANYVVNAGGLSTSGTGTANAVVNGSPNGSTLYLSMPIDTTFAGVIGGTATNANNLAITKGQPNNGRNPGTAGYNPTMLTLTGANTYDAPTTVAAGTLSVATINSVGTGHSASSNLGSPTTSANGTIYLGSNSGNIGPAVLLYTGAGETSDRIVALNNNTYGATIDSSGTGPLVFTSNVGFGTGATSAKVFGLQGSNTGANAIRGNIADNTAATSVTKLGTGTWTLSGANTYTGATTVAQGKLIAGSSNAISPSATAIVNVGAGATLQLASGIGPQVVKTLNLATGSGVLDLTNNAFTLHYGNAAGTTDPIATIAAQAASGANFGTGIISSTQAANYGVGYSDTTVTGTGDIVLKSALKGDFDINGKVDFNDFLALQANFGAASNWITGDANYDGKTDFNDFLALQANFGQSSNGAIVNVTASQIAAMTSFAQNVPEPTALALIGVGASGLVSRRRRAC